MENYYEILGLDKSATNEEIKKAYRRLSLVHHPDRPGGSENVCKKINEAYDVLGDSRKRKIYDLESSNPFLNMSNNNINPMDIFSKIFTQGLNVDNKNDAFGGIDPMFPFPPGMSPKIHIFKAGGGGMPFPDFDNNLMSSLEEPDIIEINLDLTMYEAYTGCNKPIEINRYVVKNNKKSYETETLYVQLHKGVDNNECITIKEKGNSINNILGDIKIRINLMFDENFSRKGLDLIYNKYLTLDEALCGFSFMLDHINGKSYKINHNGEYIIQPNHTKEINNMGFQRENDIGKLLIHFKIIFPENLSLEKRKEISNIINSNSSEKEQIENID